jgi:magnesium chelatase family protein
MLAKVLSGATSGLDSVPVTVEVDIAAQGLPTFTIVGLPDKAIEESKERVRAAIKNSGADFPARRITVNLAPADLPKEGPQYDLPIAVGILIASGQLVADVADKLFIGELSLDGQVRHTNGILPIALLAKQAAHQELYVPHVNATEAAVVGGLTTFGIESLEMLFRHLTKRVLLEPVVAVTFQSLLGGQQFELDFADVHGQEQAKRALEIAAAGGHNIFLKGPPGAGKTLLARSLPSILPDLSEEEAYEVTKIYSVTGNLPQGWSMMTQRPFRSPHHTTSQVGLIGGGSHPMPGEISLAHRGVLFLDELPELHRGALEALRQPMEDGIVTISRAAGAITYPAKFLLIAAANPCPCGNFRDATRRCTCLPGMIARYQKRISGPILDRIDLHLEVSAVPTAKLTASKTDQADTSAAIKVRVQRARGHQLRRLKSVGKYANSEMTTKDIQNFCPLSQSCYALLQQSVEKLKLSARGYYKVIKVARTIADLAEERYLLPIHLAEALQFRPKLDL